MRIKNPDTGRREDDLAMEAYRNGGMVTVQHLLEHAEEIVGAAPAAYGQTTSAVARTLATLIREAGITPETQVDLGLRDEW